MAMDISMRWTRRTVDSPLSFRAGTAICVYWPPLVWARPDFPHELRTQRNGSRVLVDLDRHTDQRRLGGPIGDCCRSGGIESCAVTGADELLAGRIVVHRTARVSAGCIEGYELAIIEMNQDAGISIRGQREGG